VVGYDGARNVRDEERSVGRKKLKRKPEPKRRIRWPRWTGISGSTLRDWLPIVGALLIPLLIFYGTARITGQQGKLENDRAEAEQALAEQRAQDEALQAYLNQMSGLLLEKELFNAELGSDVSTLARARTLTVLERLDRSRKEVVFQFLMEAGLVQRMAGREPVISLVRADLSDTNLSLHDLRGVNWGGIDLSGASLWGTNLSDANLSTADLSGATVRGILIGADLSNANLRSATLGGNLSNANLSGVDLNGADLRDAVLIGANLSDARVSKEQLDQAHSLEGATMPDGSKHP
jgi:uncharacterized protein YjbI with pentapeptide repeats